MAGSGEEVDMYAPADLADLPCQKVGPGNGTTPLDGAGRNRTGDVRSRRSRAWRVQMRGLVSHSED